MVAVALNCTVVPSGVLELTGNNAIEVIFPREIVTVVEPLIVPDAAVIVAVPGATPVMRPVVFTLTIVESEVDQSALPVRDFVEPSS